MKTATALALLTLLATARVAAATVTPQDAPPPPSPSPEDDSFRFGGEMKAGFRHSQSQESSIFGANNQLIGFMRTPDAGAAFELQHLSLSGEGVLTSGVFAKFDVRFFDLYNRNPTSKDGTVFVRQAFVRFGDKPDRLSGDHTTGAHVLFGMAPRFTKQTTRHLESYGLWGTAVARFEQPQVELGATFSKHVYARAMVGSGNPLFLRDTNALAGDNISEAPANSKAAYELGFPILYDAKVTDVNVRGGAETGFGLGVQWGGGDSSGIDVLAWRFGRTLGETARLRGTDYPGELGVLRGAGFPIPTKGNHRREWGVNVLAKARDLRLFAQWVDQDLAGASRHGVEAEAAWIFPLSGLFLLGESPFGNWIQPAFRFSWIKNSFSAPRAYPRLAVQWPWKKYDFGLRFGLVRDVDLTAEYTIHKVFRSLLLPNLPMREFVMTLRAGF